MAISLRIIALLLLSVASISGWYFVTAIIFLWYLFRYAGYELVVLAFILDAYYGSTLHLPMITLSVFIAWTIVIIIRPRLLLYTQDNETPP